MGKEKEVAIIMAEHCKNSYSSGFFAGFLIGGILIGILIKIIITT